MPCCDMCASRTRDSRVPLRPSSGTKPGCSACKDVHVYLISLCPMPRCRYGLKQSSAAPSALLAGQEAGRRAEETRARLEAAARQREEEARAAAAQKYVRREHRTGQLSGEAGRGRVWALGVRKGVSLRLSCGCVRGGPAVCYVNVSCRV